MKKYKYVHILWQGGAHFNKLIVEFINSSKGQFKAEEHIFVTPYKHIFDEISDFDNVIFESELPPQSATLVNKYADKGDWVFLHGMCSVSQALKIKRSSRKKIIWRTWGHDIGGYPYKSRQYLKNVVKFVLNCLWKSEVHSFRLIGIANIVDKISIEQKFGSVDTFEINYPTGNDIEFYDSFKKNMVKQNDTVNVLVGHSGISTDNHFEVIDRISKYTNENVCFYIVLSYGDEEYIKKVAQYSKEKLCDKCKLLLEPLPYKDYVDLLSRMDIAILDGKKSYALSNIMILLHFKKKIFLNKNGIIAKAFEIEKVPCGFTDQIENMNFSEFCKSLDFSDTKISSLAIKSYNEVVELWKKMLQDL